MEFDVESGKFKIDLVRKKGISKKRQIADVVGKAIASFMVDYLAETAVYNKGDATYVDIEDILVVNDDIAEAIGLDEPKMIPTGGFKPQGDAKAFRIVKKDGTVVFRSRIFAKHAGKMAVPVSKLHNKIGDGISDEEIRAIIFYAMSGVMSEAILKIIDSIDPNFRFRLEKIDLKDYNVKVVQKGLKLS